MHEKPKIHQDPKKLKGLDKEKSRAVDQFVAACGGVKSCADYLGVKKQHIQEWRQRQQFGRIWAYIIGQVPACVNAGFTKERLRPDLEEREWEFVSDDKRTAQIMERALPHMEKHFKKLPNA